MPSVWRIGATQLKHAPNPQAMWFSSETSQGISILPDQTRARAASMGTGRSRRSGRDARPVATDEPSSSVTNPWCPAEPSSVAISTSIPAWRKSFDARQHRGGAHAIEQGRRVARSPACRTEGRRGSRRSHRHSSSCPATSVPAPGTVSGQCRRRRRPQGPPAVGRSRCPAVPRPRAARRPALARAAVPRPTTR